MTRISAIMRKRRERLLSPWALEIARGLSFVAFGVIAYWALGQIAPVLATWVWGN